MLLVEFEEVVSRSDESPFRARGGSSAAPLCQARVRRSAGRFYGRAETIHADRARVLAAAYAATPERFVRHPPRPPALPAAAWINKPDNEEAAAH